MSISTSTRRASADEIAREMDRRGEVIERLEARVAALVEALRPFAAAVDAFGPDAADDTLLFGAYPLALGAPTEFRIGDFRRARAALSLAQGGTD